MLAALDQDPESVAAGALEARVADARGDWPAGLDSAKLLVTSRALRLRRDYPDWFAGDYRALHGSGVAAAHVAAFCRSDQAVTAATRLPGGLRRAGGWRDTSLPLAAGRWHDVLTGAEHDVALDGSPRPGGGRLPLADLLARLPVALLVRAGDSAPGGRGEPGVTAEPGRTTSA
jgi:(1->4)-alpha-D-glucan 1-alpha-D-glucosylmutase